MGTPSQQIPHPGPGPAGAELHLAQVSGVRPSFPPVAEQEMPCTGHLDTPGTPAPTTPPEPTVGRGP